MPGRTYILHEATLKQLREFRPNVAVLPWGATEAHNYHLPHGTDVIEATAVAHRAAAAAVERGARPVVLPTIPFGNDELQLDQVATISFQTTTSIAVFRDVCRCLLKQGIDRLILVNFHGGNEFKPMVRDAVGQLGIFVVLVQTPSLRPERTRELFKAGGDHADERETSLIMHLHPDWVSMRDAGSGERRPFKIEHLTEAGVWTPRPWSAVHPDTGNGDPSAATPEKGAAWLESMVEAVTDVICSVGAAKRGDLPYV